MILGADGKRTRIGTLARMDGYAGNVHWPESPRACVWPTWPHEGETAEKHFCGKPAAPGKPYCKAHWRRSRSQKAGGEPLDSK